MKSHDVLMYPVIIKPLANEWKLKDNYDSKNIFHVVSN
jgi:hypothetical protein